MFFVLKNKKYSKKQFQILNFFFHILKSIKYNIFRKHFYSYFYLFENYFKNNYIIIKNNYK